MLLTFSMSLCLDGVGRWLDAYLTRRARVLRICTHLHVCSWEGDNLIVPNSHGRCRHLDWGWDWDGPPDGSAEASGWVGVRNRSLHRRTKHHHRPVCREKNPDEDSESKTLAVSIIPYPGQELRDTEHSQMSVKPTGRQ